MKKFVILTMAVALIAFFAMPKWASAATMIFKGDYQIVGFASDNVHDLETDTKDGVHLTEQRFYMTAIAVSDNVKGVFQAEIGWDEWGKNYSWGDGQGLVAALNTSTGTLTSTKGEWSSAGDSGLIADSVSTNIGVKWAYIDFTIPDTTVSIKLGKQPMYPYDLVVLAGPAGPPPGIEVNWGLGEGRNLKAWWAKLTEGKTAFNSDWVASGDTHQDVFYVEYSQKSKTWGGGVYGAWSRDYREQYARNGLWATYQTIGALEGRYPAAPASVNGTKPWNIDIYYIGAFGDFNVGPVKINAHGIYSFGKMDAYVTGYPDIDISGYYGRVKASMPVTDSITLKLQSLIASGDGDMTDNEYTIFGFTEAPSRLPALNLLTDGPNLFWWGASETTSEEYTTFPGPPSGLDFLGKWYSALSATVQATNKLKLFGEVWYLSTMETDSSHMRFKDQITHPGGAGALLGTVNNKFQGIEVDLEAHYALTPTLTLSGEFDYFFPGKYYGDNADDAWLAGWMVRYQF